MDFVFCSIEKPSFSCIMPFERQYDNYFPTEDHLCKGNYKF